MATPSNLDGTVRDQNGVPVIGAKVYVYDDAGGLALDEPIVTGEDGFWEAEVPDEGFYTLKYSWGGRVRLIEANVTAGRGPIARIDATLAAAESLVGPTYPSTAAGLSATAEGDSFAVDNGDGTVTIYRKVAGVAAFQRSLATSAALASTAPGKGAALVGFKQTGAGAVDRNMRDKAGETISVKDFGAVGNGVTDDSAAIRAADAACGELRTLFFPAGIYLVKQDGANPWCLRKKAPNRWVGETMGHSVIKPDVSVPDNCDIVLEVPSDTQASRGGGCSDIAIMNPSNGTRAGRDGWRVDTSATLSNTDLQINGAIYERLTTGRPTAASPGYGFRHVNGIGNIQGGMYASKLFDCILAGGWAFEKTGDSNSVRLGRTSGPLPNKIDCIVNAAGSANTFTCEDGNWTNDGGLLQVTNCPGLKVSRVNGENFTAGAAAANGGAAIWLRAPSAYSAGTSYVTGDLVTDGGKSYRALRATVANTPASSPSDWAEHDPFECASFEDNLLSVAASFDGNAVNRIDTGGHVTFRKNRIGVGTGSIKGFIVAAPVAHADLRRNTYPVGLAVGDQLANSSPTTIFDSRGAVTQATSKSTNVTLNTAKGAITTHAAALAANASVGFLLVNDLIGANDTIAVSIKSGGTAGSYNVFVDSITDGSCRVRLTNISGGSLGEAVVIAFTVLKAGA